MATEAPVTGASTSQLMRVCARLPENSSQRDLEHQQLADDEADLLAPRAAGAPTSMSVPRWPCSLMRDDGAQEGQPDEEPARHLLATVMPELKA